MYATNPIIIEYIFCCFISYSSYFFFLIVYYLHSSTNLPSGHGTSPHSNTIPSPRRISSYWKDKVYSKCCCAPQRKLLRKEHTRYAAPPFRPHSRCCPRRCTALRGVGVERLRTIAILQICALLKLVVANLAHIVVVVWLVAMHLFKLTAEVVRIGNLLLVWINHF